MGAQPKTRKSGTGDHHVAISSPASSLAAAAENGQNFNKNQKLSNMLSNGDLKCSEVNSPPSKWGAGAHRPTTPKLAKLPKKCRNAPRWHRLNVPKRYFEVHPQTMKCISESSAEGLWELASPSGDQPSGPFSVTEHTSPRNRLLAARSEGLFLFVTGCRAEARGAAERHGRDVSAVGGLRLTLRPCKICALRRSRGPVQPRASDTASLQS